MSFGCYLFFEVPITTVYGQGSSEVPEVIALQGGSAQPQDDVHPEPSTYLVPVGVDIG